MSERFDQGSDQPGVGGPGQQVDMRLNGAGPAGPPVPGGPGNFGSTPAEKTAAANTIETELQPDTKTATEHADEAMTSAVAGFDGWETAKGLKKVADTWDQQVKTLMGRLASEKSALRGTAGLFVRNDIGVGGQFHPIGGQSKLNGL
ncbi:hypothetical protein AMK16_10205 [Streptomyces sp. CB00455]|uniref:hypothetical protein n=1 Tax=Streptomyces sp. CB00455 TaxID=1703927 RepID=UPI00093CABFA|nr:hypothetical protein [Streptomyces sp. CB00455]OKK20786.1 hypothetical protein AMK16_10205 [Streptomyces sp. CB00455]